MGGDWTALGHRRRFGTTRVCFSTASVSRPSAGAIASLLSAKSERGTCSGKTNGLDPGLSICLTIAET